MNQEFRRNALLLLPLTLAGLAALTGPAVLEARRGVNDGAPAAQATAVVVSVLPDAQGALRVCSDRHRVAAQPDAERQDGLARQHGGPSAKSQSPWWLQRARADVEHCLQAQLQGARSGPQVAQPPDAAVDIGRPAAQTGRARAGA